ncbi:unnamed protein product [Medioppia subpectinata]|uniref:Evolutionarily conserved signaling intermediate in Toll pathway, mitochondrial n=1 Tax=Medioppia subpectinata TaxID=1979941 RepID=A0A7R9Q4T8_9ACAR|nr:unnamed protein product [Medioppia subpectinata]CAG2111696.1 unnamed protein product [Medioppia subpectinata]
MNVFPRNRYRPDNIWAAGMFHFPMEQTAAVQILCEMEKNGIMPDKEMETMIIEIFSKYSSPWRKCARMSYWMTKFANANPFPLPDPLPLDALELALLALKRMCIDVQTKISVLSTAQVEGSLDKTWVVSAQSPSQRDLVSELADTETVYVDGPFKVWLRMMNLSYFTLRANNPNPVFHRDDDNIDNDEFNDVSSIPLSTFGKEDRDQVLAPKKIIHLQDDGIILAIAATGTSSRDSLLSWIRLLQATNPKLKKLSVVFTQQGMSTDIQETLADERPPPPPLNTTTTD